MPLTREAPWEALPRAKARKPGCGVEVRPSKRGWKRAVVLVGVHVLILAHIAHWKLTGSTFTPLEPSEAGETLELGYVNAGFLLLALLILATLVLGRFFCGWACHVVAYQDACAWLLGKLKLRPKPVRSRLLVFVPLYVAFDMFLLPSLLRLVDGQGFPPLAWHLTTDAFWARFPGFWIGALTFVVVGFAVVWMMGAKGFCTYGCPYGALFGIADRFSPGRIRVTDACEGCGHCTATCTSNVQVHEEVARYGMVVDPGCMKCTDCVSVCPKDALYFGFGSLPRKARKAAKAAGKDRKKRQYDFTWPEEIAMALVFVASVQLAFRGLYHKVPFLLAVALGVIAALGVVTLARLVRRRALLFQHLQLKREGRLTGAGMAAVALLPAYLLFTAHSAFVHYHAGEGERLLVAGARESRGSAARDAQLEASLVHLQRAQRWGLVDSAWLEEQLGQLLFDRGELAASERHLRRAIELLPDGRSARVYLAEVLLAEGELDPALDVLTELVELDPTQPHAARILQRLVQTRPATAERARALLERASAARAN